MQNRTALLFAAIFGMTGVIAGAFGAHGLKGTLSETQIDNWQTAVFYQLIHALVLLFVGSSLSHVKKYLSWMFIGGIFLFSGSLFLLSTRSLTGLPVGFLGPLTPIGGLLLILGWIGIMIEVARGPKHG